MVASSDDFNTSDQRLNSLQMAKEDIYYVEDEWLYDKLTDVFLPNTVMKMDKSNSA
jgi:hypothetical protein